MNFILRINFLRSSLIKCVSILVVRIEFERHKKHRAYLEITEISTKNIIFKQRTYSKILRIKDYPYFENMAPENQKGIFILKQLVAKNMTCSCSYFLHFVYLYSIYFALFLMTILCILEMPIFFLKLKRLLARWVKSVKLLYFSHLSLEIY